MPLSLLLVSRRRSDRLRVMSIKNLGENSGSPTSYDPAIDFVRFIAFFLVFFTHFINAGGNGIQVNRGQWWNNQFIQRIADFGGQGVTLFFGLTGFLLGRLLIRELEENNSVSIKSFYLRRILRIWPLYFAFIIFCGLMNLFAESPTLVSAEIPYLVTFTYNWGQIFGEVPGTMATITWSISVEEQIYLIFPILFLLLVKKTSTKYAVLLIICGLISVLGCLYIWNINPDRFTPAFLLPVGVGLLTARFEDRFKNCSPTIWRRFFVLILLVAYVLIFRNLVEFNNFRFLTFIGSAALLPALLYSCRGFITESGSRLSKGAIYVGRRSYGCYLFHWAVWTVMVGRDLFSSKTGGFSVLGVLVAFVITVGVSAVSYRYFETPFLRYRKRFQRVISP